MCLKIFCGYIFKNILDYRMSIDFYFIFVEKYVFVIYKYYLLCNYFKC